MEANLEIIADFSQYLKTGGKSQATIDCYCRDARYFFEFINAQHPDLTGIQSETLLDYKEFLELSDKENSVRRKIISIRQFFRFLKITDLIRSTPFDDVPIPSRNESIPLDLDNAAIDRVLAFYSDQKLESLKSKRDAAMLFLLGKEGIKANELIHLKWSHYRASCPNSSLFISGKRGRTIEIDEQTDKILVKYKDSLLHYEKEASLSINVEAMFVAFKGKQCSLLIPHMTRHGLKFALHEIGEKFSISNLTTEVLRHYAIQQFIGKGTSLENLLKHLGLRRPGNVGKHFGHMSRVDQKKA